MLIPTVTLVIGDKVLLGFREKQAGILSNYRIYPRIPLMDTWGEYISNFVTVNYPTLRASRVECGASPFYDAPCRYHTGIRSGRSLRGRGFGLSHA